MVNTYTKNKILTLNATVIPQPNITVSIYEWTIDTIINSNKISKLIISTNDLSLGLHTILLRVQNSCGTWSTYITKQIEIINEVIPPTNTIISNILVNSNKIYVNNIISIGQLFYIDRTYKITNIPSSYNGLEYIKTATNDRYITTNNFLSFNISQNAIIYIAYDSRIIPKPSWLSTFTNTGESIIRDNSVTFNLYSKAYTTGIVSLNGCSILPSGIGGMYIVIVKPTLIQKWKCSGNPDYTCIQAIDGIYDTQVECQTVCTAPPITDYVINMIINSIPSGAKLHITGNVILE